MAYREKKSKACRLPRHAQTLLITVAWVLGICAGGTCHEVCDLLPMVWRAGSWCSQARKYSKATWHHILMMLRPPVWLEAPNKKKSKVRKCQESLINAAQFTVDSEFLGSCPSRWFFLWHSSTHNSTNMKQQWRQRLWMVQTSRDFILCW